MRRFEAFASFAVQKQKTLEAGFKPFQEPNVTTQIDAPLNRGHKVIKRHSAGAAFEVNLAGDAGVENVVGRDACEFAPGEAPTGGGRDVYGVGSVQVDDGHAGRSNGHGSEVQRLSGSTRGQNIAALGGVGSRGDSGDGLPGDEQLQGLAAVVSTEAGSNGEVYGHIFEGLKVGLEEGFTGQDKWGSCPPCGGVAGGGGNGGHGPCPAGDSPGQDSEAFAVAHDARF